MVKDINELYKRADYITIHIHFTDKTKGMIDAKAIGAMKRGVRFINLARGEIVDDEAMPVSYTHLDGYKRQPLRSWWWRP